MQPVFISTLTVHRNHLLLVSPDDATLSRLTTIVAQSEFHIGIISDQFPLLVNLTALENIVLGCMYNNAMGIHSCREKLQPMIDRLNMNSSMDQRPQFLSRRQRLKVQLLRCLANESNFIFLPMPNRSDCDILHRTIELLNTPAFLWVSCLSNDKDVYTSLEYSIIHLDLLQ
jgi:ABC-type polar amino acid transport system ATPase subunit